MNLSLKKLRPAHYMGGICVILGLTAFYAIALKSVFSVSENADWHSFLKDSYLHHVIFFSVLQAFLSAWLSIIIGVFFARTLFYLKFVGKSLVLKLLSLTYVLPSLVAVFGIIGIYGNAGWIANITARLNIDWQPNIYGLSGILVANLFFNIPLATKIFLQSLCSIPNQQRQLAAQLGIRGWQFIRLIELPYLRQQLLSLFALVFMLCFTGFTIVLTLGGGPQYTTLEVAIYQAIVFEFNLSKAALFALLQFLFCFVIFSTMSSFSKNHIAEINQKKLWKASQSSAVKILQLFILLTILLFLLTPLLNIIVAGFNLHLIFQSLQNPQLWRALGYSITIAPISACTALIFSIALLLLSRRLQWLNYNNVANAILNAGMVILAIPTLVLAMGLFICLQHIDFTPIHLFGIVVLCNALAAMPFVLRILHTPMNNNMQYYEKLCQSLGIKGIARWYWVERHTLSHPLKYAFAIACALSLGDFTAIALFGTQDFTSLPHLLYSQLGSYRNQEGAVTALLLLIFCSLIFIFAEHHHDKT